MSKDKPIQFANLYWGLDTLIPPNAAVPDTRMQDAQQVRDMVLKAIRYDQTIRDWKRSRLKGLVDGNPPYRQSDLMAAGRADECNVNWRIAKYFLTLAQGMLYDVFSQAESYATITLDPWAAAEALKGSQSLADADVDAWSRVITEEFDRLQRRDPNFDCTNQQSQGQCVLYGTGPLGFDDELDWRPWSHESKCLFLPEMARSNQEFWEWAAVVVEYSPDKLYERIVNPKAAASRGWNVAATRRSIMYAHPLTRTGVMYQNWSYHQDLLKNGTFYYADQSKLVRCAHFYFREFPRDGEESGRITEAMIDLDGLSPSASGRLEYLYLAPRRYASWREIIHPLYWMYDVNGYHYSVTGLGIEMYSALEYENRLLCRLADDAFAPKLFFKPTTASERERMSIAQVGRYGILPAALDMVQQHVQPMLQDGIAMSREIQSLVSGNLSQYRSQALQRQQGNPATATQVNYEASEQAKMGATQLSRIYEQYDWLYAEKYRRATNPALTAAVRGGREALGFVKRCERRGVPRAALSAIDSVRATRAVGQGSAFLRQQALEFLLGIVGMLPETGRTNLVRDVIAARTGQSHADRYYPPAQELDPQLAAQTAEAMLQVSAMKTGVPPAQVPTQNPMVFASAFLQAAQGAAQSIQQGADPHEGLAFLHLALPATQAHLQRMSQDKSRAPQVKQMSEQLQQIASFADHVGAQVRQQQQQAAAQQQQLAAQQNGQSPELQLGMAKVQSHHAVAAAKAQGDLQLKAQKQQADLSLAAEKQRAESALQAAETAHGMVLDSVQARHGMTIEGARTHHGMAVNHATAAHAAALKTAQAAHDAHLAEAQAAHEASLREKATAAKPANGKPASKQ